MRRFTFCLLVIVFAGYSIFLSLRESPVIGHVFLKNAEAAELPFAWPPAIGSKYPDLKLIDQTGRATRLSQFRGKVILVELIGIPCGACQAYAGAHEVGAFCNGKVQPNLESIEAYAERYGEFDLHDEDVVYVQLLLFNNKMQAPTLEEGRAWAEHFGMQRAQNQIVLVGTDGFVTRETYEMIPGFHLIDRDFVFRNDSSGHRPIHNLYTELLPTMGRLVQEK